MECIPNEKSLKHRHKQTESEIQPYIFGDHKPGRLLYGGYNRLYPRYFEQKIHSV